ncbi:extracellular solute-binding protein [Treponema maltophilum]|uniref:extracellular solute-binding protein n=1 Tax=Treponema maltophilum TaxID=51160 RepID=UPI003D8DE169
MKKKKCLFTALVLLLVLIVPFWANGSKDDTSVSGSDKDRGVTTIVYWQYFLDTKVALMKKLITEFEARNPDIKVIQETVPYDNYNVKVAATVPTGKGPNIVCLFYGWLPQYIKAGYLQPLPESAFSPARVEAEFFPMVTASKFDGKYYAIPTAVRGLSLIYNKDLFEKAGMDVSKPPKTLDEYVKMAQALTITDGKGNIVQAGGDLQVNGQIHSWWREVLIRQFGGAPYSDDGKKVTYDCQAGYDAMRFLTDLQTKYKIGFDSFMDTNDTAFINNALAMTIEGSFRLAKFNNTKGLNYYVAELPERNGIKSNAASYWANGITKFTTGKEFEASVRFLQFLTSEYAMERWLAEVGELPAKTAVASKPELLSDPKIGPFLKGLSYAHATKFVDEMGQRQVVIDAFNKIVLDGMTPEKAVHEAAVEEQKILDKYYKK